MDGSEDSYSIENRYSDSRSPPILLASIESTRGETHPDVLTVISIRLALSSDQNNCVLLRICSIRKLSRSVWNSFGHLHVRVVYIPSRASTATQQIVRLGQQLPFIFYSCFCTCLCSCNWVLIKTNILQTNTIFSQNVMQSSLLRHEELCQP